MLLGAYLVIPKTLEIWPSPWYLPFFLWALLIALTVLLFIPLRGQDDF